MTLGSTVYPAPMEKLTKVFPLLVVALFAWVTAFPPGWLLTLGLWRFPLAGSIVFLGLLVMVILIVADDLKKSLSIEEAPNVELPENMSRRVEEFLGQGFVQTGPILETGTAPRTLLVPLMCRAEKTYGSVFRVGGENGKVAFDMFSFFQRCEGGLASSVEPGAAMLPAENGAFHQVIVGTDVRGLLIAHRTACAYLAEHGLPLRDIEAGSFIADLKHAIERHRRHFLAAPLRHALIIVWRSASRVTPHLGSLEKQTEIEKRIEKLQGVTYNV